MLWWCGPWRDSATEPREQLFPCVGDGVELLFVLPPLALPSAVLTLTSVLSFHSSSFPFPFCPVPPSRLASPQPHLLFRLRLPSFPRVFLLPVSHVASLRLASCSSFGAHHLGQLALAALFLSVASLQVACSHEPLFPLLLLAVAPLLHARLGL